MRASIREAEPGVLQARAIEAQELGLLESPGEISDSCVEIATVERHALPQHHYRCLGSTPGGPRSGYISNGLTMTLMTLGLHEQVA